MAIGLGSRLAEACFAQFTALLFKSELTVPQKIEHMGDFSRAFAS